ncbi:MAG TPA: YlmC/YmxH family sporulation protein [Bacillota bacterium]|nr:YlmC/YmxH family sporulation protein [Bacillota bacterium]
MRASELEGKEVIELNSGERIGVISNCELLLNLSAGIIEALIIEKSNWRGEKSIRTIPWSCIRTISSDLILVEEPADLRSSSNILIDTDNES